MVLFREFGQYLILTESYQRVRHTLLRSRLLNGQKKQADVPLLSARNNHCLFLEKGYKVSMKNLFFAVLHSVGCTQKKLAHIRPGEEEEWYHAMNFDQLISAGYSPESATKILEKKSDTLIEKIGKILSEKNIHIVHRDDNTYPSLLKNTPDAPTILYVR